MMPSGSLQTTLTPGSLLEHPQSASALSASASYPHSLFALSLLTLDDTCTKLVLLGHTSREKPLCHPETKSVCTGTSEQSSKSTQTNVSEQHMSQSRNSLTQCQLSQSRNLRRQRHLSQSRNVCRRYHLLQSRNMCRRYHLSQSRNWCRRYHLSQSRNSRRQRHLSQSRNVCRRYHLSQSRNLCRQHHLSQSRNWCRQRHLSQSRNLCRQRHLSQSRNLCRQRHLSQSRNSGTQCHLSQSRNSCRQRHLSQSRNLCRQRHLSQSRNLCRQRHLSQSRNSGTQCHLSQSRNSCRQRHLSQSRNLCRQRHLSQSRNLCRRRHLSQSRNSSTQCHLSQSRNSCRQRHLSQSRNSGTQCHLSQSRNLCRQRHLSQSRNWCRRCHPSQSRNVCRRCHLSQSRNSGAQCHLSQSRNCCRRCHLLQSRNVCRRCHLPQSRNSGTQCQLSQSRNSGTQCHLSQSRNSGTQCHLSQSRNSGTQCQLSEELSPEGRVVVEDSVEANKPRNEKESVATSNLNRIPSELSEEHANHSHRNQRDHLERLSKQQAEHGKNPASVLLSSQVSGQGHVFNRQVTMSPEEVKMTEETDDVKPEQDECKANGGALGGKTSHISEHVEKDPPFNPKVKRLADDETHTPETGHQSKISLNLFQESLNRSTALMELCPAQSEQRQKLDVQELEKKKTDKSTILKELTSSSTIRFAPKVQVTVYPCQNGDRRFEEESARFASFSEKQLPSGVWVSTLSGAGFYCQDDSTICSLLRCAFCDISVDINSFVHTDPVQLHRDRSPNCPMVKGAANNTSLQERGQISGHYFIKLMFQATTEQHKHPRLSRGSEKEHKHQQRPLTSHVRGSRTDEFSSSSTGQSVPDSRCPALSAPENDRRTAAHTPEPIRAQAPEPARLPAHTSEPIRAQAPEPGRLPAHTREPIRAQAPEPGRLPAHTHEPIRAQAPEPARQPQTPQLGLPPPLPSEPIRAQIPGNGMPFQTARLVSSHQQEIAPSPRPTETPGRNASSQSGSNVNAAPATPRAGPAPQSPPSSTADPPRQLVTYSQLGIYTQEPKRPDLAIATSRVNTYTGWPHATTHSPEEMAEAGFYYVGQNDLVRCFYCKGGLKSWSGPLHPWVEHARFYPQCPFVGQVKGQEFIDVVQELKERQDTISASEVEEELENRRRPVNRRQAEAMANVVADDAAEMAEGAVGGAVVGGAEGGDDATQLSKIAEDLEEENQDIKNERICKICQVNEVSILFLPCGHLVSCAQCAPALRSCAICRQRVKGRVRAIGDND